jgi:hypothetical protein
MLRSVIIAGFVASVSLLPAVADALGGGGGRGRGGDRGQSQSYSANDGQRHGGTPGGTGGGNGGEIVQASEPLALLVVGAALLGVVMLRPRQ